MRIRRITDAVNTLHDGVHRRIITNSSIGAVEVVVDGTRQTDAWEVEFHAKVTGTGERTVTTNDHKGVDLLLFAGLVSLLHTLGRHKLLTAGRLQDRTATGDDTRDVLRRELLHLTLDEAVVAAIDTLDVETVVDTCARHGTDGCIHAGSIATRRQNSNSLNLCHSLLIDWLCCKVTKNR